MGTTQSSQCPEPEDPVFSDVKEFFDKFWIRVVQHWAKKDKNAVITFVPEYGYEITLQIDIYRPLFLLTLLVIVLFHIIRTEVLGLMARLLIVKARDCSSYLRMLFRLECSRDRRQHDAVDDERTTGI